MRRSKQNNNYTIEIKCDTINIFFFAGLYGVAMGSFNGGIQVVYVLIKLPFLFLGTLIVTLIATFILDVLVGSVFSFKQYIAIMLLVLAVTSLVLAPLAIILYFFVFTSASHDFIILVNIGLFAIAGLFGVYAFFLARRFIHREEKRKKRIAAVIICIFLYGFVGLQMAWMLRPWIGLFLDESKPTPFLRETIKGNVYVEIYRAYDRLQKGEYY